MSTRRLERPAIVSRSEWIAARQGLLAKEKAFTRAYDALNRDRRALPWVKVDNAYVFDGPSGRETLADLFAGRSQLIVNHFMFGPGWTEGCVGCSFGADHLTGALVHLAQRDVSYVAVSRAPLAEIEAFKRRMGWSFKWVSSFGSDFNYDFHVSFTPEDAAAGTVYYNYATQPYVSEESSGVSVFYKDDGEIFHTYSTYARGGELGLGTYVLLDMTPKGRDEHGPHHSLVDWVRHHDRYDAGGRVDASGRYHAAAETDACCHCADDATGQPART
jgi:predicted dithiol-disulfide oxidoreductase (DUF899 family)